MDDLPRLRVPGGVVLHRLERRELAQRAAGELGAEHQSLEARDQRVAPEHGHEPGNAGAGQLAEAAVVAGAHAQRGEVVHRLAERVLQNVPARSDLGHAQLPRVERLLHPGALVAEVPLGGGRRARRPVRRPDDDVHAQLPLLARLQQDVIGNAATVDRAAAREDHLRPAESFAIGEHELVVRIVELGRHRLRQRLRVARVSEREVPLLDRDDVREVGAELDPELQLHRLGRLVLEDDVILHSFADEALTLDRDRVERQLVRARIAQEERSREVVDGPRREEERPLAVDRQLEAGEKSRVVREQAVRRVDEIADLVGDAERGAVEDAKVGHYDGVRRMRPPEA